MTWGASPPVVQPGPKHPKVVHPCGSQRGSHWLLASYALRACSRALLAVPTHALASFSCVALHGAYWVLMAVRGHRGDTSRAPHRCCAAWRVMPRREPISAQE
jgi:hypothetical protein